MTILSALNSRCGPDVIPGVPWCQITAFRNRIIHEYFGISMDNVWEIIRDDIPELKKKLGKVK